MTASLKAAYPLAWPDGWVRTRPEHRRANSNWRNTFGVYRDHLVDEVERLKSTSLVISTNIPLTLKGLPREGYSAPDPGVAVYFGRRKREDRSWRDILEINVDDGPADRYKSQANVELVDRQFKRLAVKYHPDVPRTGDIAVFQALTRARDDAKDFFNGVKRADHEYVLACDLFIDVRLNMHAIGLTVSAIRQIERCGASSMLERAFRGFMAALPAQGMTA